MYITCLICTYLLLKKFLRYNISAGKSSGKSSEFCITYKCIDNSSFNPHSGILFKHGIDSHFFLSCCYNQHICSFCNIIYKGILIIIIYLSEICWYIRKKIFVRNLKKHISLLLRLKLHNIYNLKWSILYIIISCRILTLKLLNFLNGNIHLPFFEIV